MLSKLFYYMVTHPGLPSAVVVSAVAGWMVTAAASNFSSIDSKEPVYIMLVFYVLFCYMLASLGYSYDRLVAVSLGEDDWLMEKLFPQSWVVVYRDGLKKKVGRVHMTKSQALAAACGCSSAIGIMNSRYKRKRLFLKTCVLDQTE